MKALSLMATVLALGPSLTTIDAEATTAPASAAPLTQPKRSWLGAIAGLAAGLGLAAIAAIALIMRRRAPRQQPSMAGADRMAFAQAGLEPGKAPSPTRDATARHPVDAGLASDSARVEVLPLASRHIPRDFDVLSFEPQAIVNFLRLQAASSSAGAFARKTTHRRSRSTKSDTWKSRAMAMRAGCFRKSSNCHELF